MYITSLTSDSVFYLHVQSYIYLFIYYIFLYMQAQWQQQQGGVGVGGMGPGGPIQMGRAQGMGVPQGMQGMGGAQFGYPGMPYQPVNSMTGTVYT